MLSPDTIVHLAQTAIVALLIAGRWLQAREGGEQVTAAQLAEVRKALDDRATGDRVTALERRVQGEHDERKRFVERMHVDLGLIRTEQARHDERLKGLERHP